MSILSDLMATGFSAGEAIQLLALISGEADGVFIDLTVTNNATIEGLLDAAFISTGTVTRRTLANRGDDQVNSLDYGVVMDGVTDNLAAFNLARAGAGFNGSVFVPSGSTVFPNGISSGISTPVLWKLDGTTFPGGVSPIITIGKAGDLVEGFFNGNKYFGKRSSVIDQGPVVRVDLVQNATGGNVNVVEYGIEIVASQGAANTNSVWALGVIGDTTADATSGGFVGLQSTVRKHAGAFAWGIQSVTLDDTGLPSSGNGHGFVGAEIAVRANGLDDATNSESYGGVGIRNVVHLTLNRSNASLDNPSNFAHGIWISGDADAVNSWVSSVYTVGTSMKTYSVFDSRGASVPAGYTDPLAAVRMLHEHIVDFNGGASLDSAAGNYLQYTTSGTARLRYMAGATEAASIGNTGNATFAGTLGTGGALITPAPVTKTSDFTMGATETTVICNGGATITVTLPSASSSTGQWRRIQTIAAFTVVSASSNVVPLTGGAAGTAILAGTAGKWAILQSNGTNWVVTAGN